MKIKRLISLLLTLVLLGSLVPALAADAGSRQDPLLSRSYVDSWSSAVLSHAEATAHTAAQTALDKALQTHDNALHGSAGKSRICTLYPGNTVALKTGDCFTVLSGDAGVAISAGALVDATAGAKAVSGALRTAHRYIACEDLQAMITCTQTVSLLLSAGASVTRFVDVPADAWYADYVEYAAVNGLMSGIGDRRFAPDDVLTRAMFVTVLGQLAQIDEADYPAVSFSDVVPGSWYAPYVAWAAQQDIVSGTGNGRFEPETPITREQMASIIARYVQSTGKTLPTIADPVVFKDMDAVSGWALDGVELMRMTGIISGDDRGTSTRSALPRAHRPPPFLRSCGRHSCTQKRNF
ncbi:MAG: S-layer homology domain-containing protein [Oscillospiraceae bacterium]